VAAESKSRRLLAFKAYKVFPSLQLDDIFLYLLFSCTFRCRFFTRPIRYGFPIYIIAEGPAYSYRVERCKNNNNKYLFIGYR